MVLVGNPWFRYKEDGFMAEITWFFGKNHAVVGKQTDIAVQKIHHYRVKEF